MVRKKCANEFIGAAIRDCRENEIELLELHIGIGWRERENALGEISNDSIGLF